MRVKDPGIVGRRIREARERKVWTHRDLAGALGVTSQSISAWETGARRPSTEAVARIARALDVPVSFLYGSEAAANEDEAILHAARRVPAELKGLAVAVLDVLATGRDGLGKVEALTLVGLSSQNRVVSSA